MAKNYKEYLKKLENTYYKGNLGATYFEDETTFKLWSPVASDVKVCIYRTGTDGEEGAAMLSKNKMKYSKEYGTWYLTLDGDYKNMYYTYEVTVNGKTNEIVDPYAKAVGANGDRGMVVDLKSTNPEGWSDDKFNRVNTASEAVVWEISVRDFSASESSGVSEKNRGKFMAFCENGTTVNASEDTLPSCVSYLKALGVNYVQINPFYDFASIDETADLSEQYNWGYDPKNYNVPEGSYSSNPYDGNTRILECKSMIQALHKAGIGVIMDVVYNHTFESENSWFNLAVPDYYYRIGENGEWSNGSGCGNDTASERIMFREFMKNSVCYWAEEYHIDGFRFDLMGLHDVDTMNYIRTELDKLENGEKILMYGEAWNMETKSDPSVLLANQDNLYKLSKRIGAFNDTTRDAIKGNVFNEAEKGFVQNGSSKAGIRKGIEGQTSTGWASVSSQCVNYSSCHDNLTLYDKLVKTEIKKDDKFRIRDENLVSMNKLAGAIVLTSQGMPFMLAGEEMGRSKDGDENSYKSPVTENRIDWNIMNQYAEVVDYYRGLIYIRKNVDLFTQAKDDYSKDIEYLDAPEGAIAYTIKGEGKVKKATVIFNGSNKSVDVSLDKDTVWVQLANEKIAGLMALKYIDDGKITVEKSSCAILIDQSSYDSFEEKWDKCYVYVKYKDSSTNSIFYEQILNGKEGESYSVTTPENVLFNYNVSTSTGKTKGTFSKEPAEVLINCKHYTGNFSKVIFKYVDEYDDEISNSILMRNRTGQQYFTPAVAGIKGYDLELDKLPENGAGKYTDEDIEVVYRYKSIPVSTEEDPNAEKSADTTMNCRANVIYMGNNGEILDVKSYLGTDGDKVEISYLDFNGYEYQSMSNDNAVFSDVESNIVLNYSKKTLVLPIIAGSIVCVAIVAGVIFAIFAASSKKRRKMDNMLIDDK